MAKVLISLPDELVKRIDREVQARGGTRSEFLQDAASQALGWPSSDAVAAALERGRRALADAGDFEASELIAADRAARDGDDRRHR